MSSKKMNEKLTIKKGMKVQVLPFEYEQHLVDGAVVNPPRVRRHPGYCWVVVADVFPDSVTGEDMVDVFVGNAGDVDTVPGSACRILGEEGIIRIRCNSEDEALARARAIFAERTDVDWVLCEGRVTLSLDNFWIGDLLLHRSERGRVVIGETVEQAQAALLSC